MISGLQSIIITIVVAVIIIARAWPEYKRLCAAGTKPIRPTESIKSNGDK